MDAFTLMLTYMGPYPTANAIQGEALAPNTATNPCPAELDVKTEPQHAERMKMQVIPIMRADLAIHGGVTAGRPSLSPWPP